MKHAIACIAQRPVRMAGDDGVPPAFMGGGQRLGVVYNADAQVAELDGFNLAQRVGPVAEVVVAANRGDGSKQGELAQNPRVADVARVHDEIAPAQDIDRSGSQQPMRVRDDANANEQVLCTTLEFGVF